MEVVRERRSPRNLVLLWLTLFIFLGSAGAYCAALRGGHVPPERMALVGAAWGAFIGLLYSMELSRVRTGIRRCTGGALGVAAGVFSGWMLGWSVESMLLIGGVAALCGIVAERWVKHISSFT